jgi:hypothetical protein
MATIKGKRLAAVWPMILLIAGILIAAAFYSYSMFHLIIPTKAAISNVAMCDENVSPDDPSTFSCFDASGHWKPIPYNASPIIAAIAILMVSAFPLLAQSGVKTWSASPFKGHVTFWSFAFGIPMTLLGLHLNFIEGTLSADWAAHIIFYTALISILLTVPIWYLFTKPMMSRRRKKYNA